MDDEWTWSNLGGLGGSADDSAGTVVQTDTPPTIRRSSVAVVDGTIVDLVISNLTEYVPYLSVWNFVTNGYGQINLGGTRTAGESTQMQLKFSFVQHATDTPYPLKKFRMGFYDFDTAKNGNGVECLKVSTAHATSYQLDADTELVPPSLDLSEPNPEVCASTWGKGTDNPEYNAPGTGLNATQRARALEVTYEDTSELEVTFSIGCCIGTGRNFAYAGASPQIAILDGCPSPPPNFNPRPPPNPPKPPPSRL